MDFDDLDDCEVAAGPTPQDVRAELVNNCKPEAKEFPIPEGKCFGDGKKLKMLFLHGGGSNATIAKMQVTNVMKEVPGHKDIMEWVHYSGPLKVPLGWNGDFSLKPFGPDYYIYFERWPYANCQREAWDGIEETMKDFKKFIKEHGPFDGVCGFDMGGEFLVHVARMAAEGLEPAFERQFRFMILFTTGQSKHLSPMGKDRPKYQLKLPAFISWCDGDQNHTHLWYEENVLFFDKSVREVVRHQSGHMPPRITKEGSPSEHERLCRFIDCMKRGKDWAPSEHEDNAWCQNLFLPIVRKDPEAFDVPSDSRKKRLLVFTDPMGAHDLEQRIKDMEQLKKDGMLQDVKGEKFKFSGTMPDQVGNIRVKLEVCALQSEAFDEAASAAGIKVEHFPYTGKQRSYDWHIKKEEIPSPQFFTEDIVAGDPHAKLGQLWADQLMSKFAIEDEDWLGVVGIGTGAMIALGAANRLIYERKRRPAGIWLCNPPSKLPWSSTAEPCEFLDTPIRSLVNESSICGPTWRFEVATCGPYSCGTYKDAKELVSMVVDEFKAM